MRDRGMPRLQFRRHLPGGRAAEQFSLARRIGQRFPGAGDDLDSADGHDIPRKQQPVGGDRLPADQCAVAAFKIPDRPARRRSKNFGMKPAGLLVVQHHAVAGSTAERHAFPGQEWNHSLAGNGITNEQIGGE